jgi:glycosidase
MLRGDPRRIRLAYSLMFSLPGAPLLFYGEEIGMGELEGVGDRRAVRTPMQWRRGSTAGFSTARPSRLVRELPGGGYGPEHVNVHDQLRSPDSLLSFVKTLIARYRSAPEIAWGDLALHDVGDPQVLVHSLRTDEATFLAVHNIGDDARHIDIAADAVGPDRLVDLLEPVVPVEAEDGAFRVALDGWGFRWFRAGAEH